MLETDNITYSMAYTEVLEIFRHLPISDLKKIPLEEIKFLNKNSDKNYKYKIDPNIPIEEQKVSKKANALLILYFKKYFATDLQNKKIDIILKNNQIYIENEKKERIKKENLFEKDNKKDEEKEETMAIIEYKQTIFKTILEKIKRFFRKK